VPFAHHPWWQLCQGLKRLLSLWPRGHICGAGSGRRRGLGCLGAAFRSSNPDEIVEKDFTGTGGQHAIAQINTDDLRADKRGGGDTGVFSGGGGLEDDLVGAGGNRIAIKVGAVPGDKMIAGCKFRVGGLQGFDGLAVGVLQGKGDACGGAV